MFLSEKRELHKNKNKKKREFPGGQVAKTLPVVPKQRATGSIPGQGIRSHMLQLRLAAFK